MRTAKEHCHDAQRSMFYAIYHGEMSLQNEAWGEAQAPTAKFTRTSCVRAPHKPRGVGYGFAQEAGQQALSELLHVQPSPQDTPPAHAPGVVFGQHVPLRHTSTAPH